MNLGDKVVFSVKYTRVEKKVSNTKHDRVWVETQIRETEGIFVGYRTLIKTEFDYTPYYDEDHGLIQELDYINKPQCKCALVAINKKQILRVPLNAL